MDLSGLQMGKRIEAIQLFTLLTRYAVKYGYQARPGGELRAEIIDLTGKLDDEIAARAHIEAHLKEIEAQMKQMEESRGTQLETTVVNLEGQIVATKQEFQAELAKLREDGARRLAFVTKELELEQSARKNLEDRAKEDRAYATTEIDSINEKLTTLIAKGEAENKAREKEVKQMKEDHAADIERLASSMSAGLETEGAAREQLRDELRVALDARQPDSLFQEHVREDFQSVDARLGDVEKILVHNGLEVPRHWSQTGSQSTRYSREPISRAMSHRSSEAPTAHDRLAGPLSRRRQTQQPSEAPSADYRLTDPLSLRQQTQRPSEAPSADYRLTDPLSLRQQTQRPSEAPSADDRETDPLRDDQQVHQSIEPVPAPFGMAEQFRRYRGDQTGMTPSEDDGQEGPFEGDQSSRVRQPGGTGTAPSTPSGRTLPLGRSPTRAPPDSEPPYRMSRAGSIKRDREAIFQNLPDLRTAKKATPTRDDLRKVDAPFDLAVTRPRPTQPLEGRSSTFEPLLPEYVNIGPEGSPVMQKQEQPTADPPHTDELPMEESSPARGLRRQRSLIPRKSRGDLRSAFAKEGAADKAVAATQTTGLRPPVFSQGTPGRPAITPAGPAPPAVNPGVRTSSFGQPGVAGGSSRLPPVTGQALPRFGQPGPAQPIFGRPSFPAAQVAGNPAPTFTVARPSARVTIQGAHPPSIMGRVQRVQAAPNANAPVSRLEINTPTGRLPVIWCLDELVDGSVTFSQASELASNLPPDHIKVFEQQWNAMSQTYAGYSSAFPDLATALMKVYDDGCASTVVDRDLAQDTRAKAARSYGCKRCWDRHRLCIRRSEESNALMVMPLQPACRRTDPITVRGSNTDKGHVELYFYTSEMPKSRRVKTDVWDMA